MELHGYITGLVPEQHILLKRTDASLALILNRANSPVCAFDIHLLQKVTLDPGWFAPEFKVDVELEDLIMDLNVAGFRTSGCCRGKVCADETSHLDAAYVAFADYLPYELLAACNQAGLHCTNVSPYALREVPTLNFRSRISPWIRDGSRPPEPLTVEQLALNATFPNVVRQVLAARVPLRSAEIRRLAEAAARTSG